jgi:uncharacterized protein (DUF2147 family)
MVSSFVRLTGNLLVSSVLTLILAFASFSQSPQPPQPSQPSQSHPVEGSYSVTATSAELGTINFLMALKRNGEKWTGEVKDSPTPLTFSTITVDEGNKVKIVGDASGTALTINGKLDGSKLTGDWAAGDIKGTWTAEKRKDEELKPGENSVASTSGSGGYTSSSSATAAAGLEGAYDATVVADGQGELTFTLLIKRDGEQLVTEVEGGGDLNITGIAVKDPDEVKLTATYQGQGPIPLNGKRNGNELAGKWAAGPFSGTWSAKKKSSQK